MEGDKSEEPKTKQTQKVSSGNSESGQPGSISDVEGSEDGLASGDSLPRDVTDLVGPDADCTVTDPETQQDSEGKTSESWLPELSLPVLAAGGAFVVAVLFGGWYSVEEKLNNNNFLHINALGVGIDDKCELNSKFVLTQISN